MASKGAVGLDIGTRSVSVAHVDVRRGKERVVNFGGVELPLDAVHEGEVLDPAAVAAKVRELLATARIREKKVHLGVGNQRVVVRQIELPWMEASELRASLRYQVQEHIPIPVEDAELDVHVLGEHTTDEGERMLRILLVAAHKDMVASHVAAATEAGLRPVGVDLNPFAVLRTVRPERTLAEATDEVLIDIGAGVTNILVHEGGVPKFVRMLVLGGDDITNALAGGLDIEVDEAERLKRRIGLDPAGDQPAAGIIDEHARSFVEELRSSLDYYAVQSGGNRVARIVLTGGGSLLTGLADRIADTLRTPVDLANPFDASPAVGTAFGADELAQVGPVLTTAIGLALGGIE